MPAVAIVFQGPEISPMARFACLVWLTVLSRGVSAEDVDECAEGAEMRMLQVGKATLKSADLQNCGHLTQDTCYEGANSVCSNNCPIHTHGKDCYRPIPEVMAEHPGMDGYCYFNMTGFWVVPVAAENPDFVQSSRLGVLGLRCSDYPGLSNGPPRSLHFEGEVLTTHMDCPHYIYDDLYAYSLGQLQGQGVDPAWMKEPQHWMAVSEKICQDIQKTWNFTNDELHLADWLDDNAVIYVKTACAANSEPGTSDPVVLAKAGYHSATDCQPVTKRDYHKHHYVKCLLGYANSGSDMAYLNGRACLLENNHIGHGNECPYVLPLIDY